MSRSGLTGGHAVMDGPLCKVCAWDQAPGQLRRTARLISSWMHRLFTSVLFFFLRLTRRGTVTANGQRLGQEDRSQPALQPKKRSDIEPRSSSATQLCGMLLLPLLTAALPLALAAPHAARDNGGSTATPTSSAPQVTITPAGTNGQGVVINGVSQRQLGQDVYLGIPFAAPRKPTHSSIW